MTSQNRAPIFLFLMLASGCARQEHVHEGSGSHSHERSHGHDSKGQAHGSSVLEPDTGHSHAHGEDETSISVTLWGERTQLFVEFPALALGSESAFAAHLTALNNHAAIDTGEVEVELSGGGQPVERFIATQPSVAGIFRPVVKPSFVGTRQVVLRWNAQMGSEVHNLGEYTVFHSRAEAEKSSVGDAPSHDGISYLLEQQWRTPFRIQQVVARTMRPNFPAFARLVQPPETETLIVAPRSGRVVVIDDRFPRVGESIAPGNVLFLLTTAPQEGGDPASLDLALERAEIHTQAARREVERLAPLAAQGVVAQRRLDEAKSELAAAQAEQRSASRRKHNLSQTQRIGSGADALAVPAPIAGTLAELFVSPGAWVAEGDVLARIVDRSRLQLRVDVPEVYVGRLGEISGVWFQLEKGAGAIELTRSELVSIGTEIDEKTRTLPVRFRIDNARRNFFAGMNTRANLIMDTPRVSTAIPRSAVVDDGGVDVVYIQTGGETFIRRPVQLGLQDGEYVEVRAGVETGNWIVTQGAYSVRLASKSTESIGHGHAH